MKLDPQTLSIAAQSFGVELSALRPLGGMDGLACEYERDGFAYVLKIVRLDKDNPDQKTQIAEKKSNTSTEKNGRLKHSKSGEPNREQYPYRELRV